MASTSACGRPPSWVRPRPITRPSRTITQPTAGLGQVRPSDRRASASVARIIASVLEVGLGEVGDELLEVLGLAEIAIDRGEAHIGHRIERAQRVHHQLTDLRRGNLALAGAFEAPHDAVDHALGALGIDRALATRHLDRAGELVAVELHTLAVLLHHRQLAQLHALEGGETRSAGRAVTPPADRGIIVSRSRVLNLCVLVTAEWTAHLVPLFILWLGALSVAVNGKAGTERVHLGTHLFLDLSVAVRAVVGDTVEHVGDQVTDLAEFGRAEAARRPGRRAEPNPRGDRVFLGVTWNAVLVDGDAGAIEHLLGRHAGRLLGPQIDQHDVAVGAARDDFQAAFAERRGQRARIVDDVLSIDLEVGPERLAEGDGLGGDDVHQRPALQAGEHRRVDLLADLGVGRQHHAAARAAQGLVGRRRHDMGMRQWGGIDAGGDEAGIVRHIDHEEGANLVGHLAEARPVDVTRVGRSAGHDQPGLLLARHRFHLLVVDQVAVGLDAVRHDLEPLARLVGRRAVCEMAALVECHAHEFVAGLQQRHEYRLVGLRAGVRLHVGERAVEQLAGAVDGELFGLVDFLAAAVVAPAGIALGVFVGEHRARRFQHRARDDVLRGDKLDLLALAVQLALEHRIDRRIRLGEPLGEHGQREIAHLGSGLTHVVQPLESLATRPTWRPPLNSVARKTLSASRAVSGPISRWPNATASLCSRANLADVTSWANAARTLGWRLAAIGMPISVPHTRTPRSALPAAMTSVMAPPKSG